MRARFGRRAGGLGARLLGCCILVLAASGCDDLLGTDDAVISEPFEFVRDATGRSSFRLTGVNGNIVITGTAQGETFDVTGFRLVRNCSESEAEDWIDRLEVEVTETADAIVVQTVQPRNTDPCTLEVRYELRVPGRLAATVVNVNGNVEIDGLTGGTAVTNVNGNVALAGLEGPTQVLLTNGNIAAGLAIEGDEVINMATVNGTVTLTIPSTTNASLTATLVNGTIQVTNLTLADRVTTETMVSGTLGTGDGGIVLRTTNGNIGIAGT